MSHLDDRSQQMNVKPQSSSHSFRKAFALGATWWIVASLVASAHNNIHSSGHIFGELLVPSVAAARIAGAAARMTRVRMVWVVIIAVFLAAWFAIRFAAVVGKL